MAEKKTEESDESDEDILEAAKKDLRSCIDFQAPERAKMLDDQKFCTLDQWPEDIRRERENDVENGPRPCLTIDKINQYIVQVVNDMRQGKPGINVRPQDDEADIETAKVLKGIVRNIEDQSNADIAYAVAGENAVKIGQGFFRITTEYVSDDSFDQDIFIRPLPDTFSVYMGEHIMPDGSDADTAYIVEAMDVKKFESLFPKAKSKEEDFDGLGENIVYWKTDKSVTVVEEYRIKRSIYELLFLSDGTTMKRSDYDKWPKEAGPQPEIQGTRQCEEKNLKWRKMTGIEVLEKRELPGKYIPIVEMIGREAQFEGKRILWGLVRPAKDSLRMYNYFASTVTEKMGLAPKAPFIGAKGQFAGQEDRWKKANRVNYSYLEYDPIDVNGNAIPAPQRVGPTPMEAALLHQMQVIEHDVQTSLGMFKAATGESESQQSGRAILALQRESDTGTFHFGANQGVSIRHAGRIIVDMIPHYYDTKRIVRILGEDGEPQTVQLDPSQDVAHKKIQTEQGIKSIHNPGVGKYDVSITVGPSYNTKRMEAAATFVELAKGATDPGSAAVMRYLTVKNSDFTYSDEAAKMLKTLLPPQALQAVSQNTPIPPEAQAEIQQLHQGVMAANQHIQQLTQENMQLKSGAQEAQAKISASRDEALGKLSVLKEQHQNEIELERAKALDAHNLAIEAAHNEAALKKYIAELNARTELEVAEISKNSALQIAQINAASQAVTAN